MITVEQFKEELEKLKNKPNVDKMVEFTGLLTEYFKRKQIQPIVVGGLSVEIYTRSHYTTRDIELIAPGRNEIGDLLTNSLGFKQLGRVWYHEDLELALKIPSNHLEGNTDKIVIMKLPSGREIYVIGLEDIIIHRLESAIVSNKNNPQYMEDFEWAERLFKMHKDNAELLDLDYLLNEAKKVNLDKYIKQWLKEK